MKNPINKSTLLCPVVALFLGSCDFAGMEYQTENDYKAKEITNKIDMTVWEYIQEDEDDVFSGLKEAIEYAGIEDLYKIPGNTHILLTNSALTSFTDNNSYWNMNKVPKKDGSGDLVRGGSWTQYDKNEVAELLKYHILKGEWSFFNLSDATNWVETYGEGKFNYILDGQTIQGDTAVMDIKIGMDRNLPIHLNNYSWNIRGVLDAATASTRTVNTHAKDGCIHTCNYYQVRPTRSFLNME